MPKPPMNDEVIVFTPTGETNKYGLPDFTQSISKARVAYSTEVFQLSDGTKFASTVKETDGTKFTETLQVDLPPETKIQYSSEIQWIDRFGEVVRGGVTVLDETLNYSGKKVYYRTAYIGKKRKY